jgi:hypothetical protein
MTHAIRFLLPGLALTLSLAAPATAAAPEPFLVVANGSVGIEQIPASTLSRIFLKKQTRWSDGAAILVAEIGDKEVRAAFSAQVHSMSLSALRSYWAQMVFSGRDVPPVEKGTAEALLAWVREHPGAIAVVPPGTALVGVKRIVVE